MPEGCETLSTKRLIKGKRKYQGLKAKVDYNHHVDLQELPIENVEGR